MTREESDSRFEAHRRYTDIQYVVRGEKRIGVIELERTTVVEPYDSSRDIAFMTAPENNYRFPDPELLAIQPGNPRKSSVTPAVSAGPLTRNLTSFIAKVQWLP